MMLQQCTDPHTECPHTSYVVTKFLPVQMVPRPRYSSLSLFTFELRTSP